MNRGVHTVRVTISTVESQILTPVIATPVRVGMVVFVDLLKKLTSLFFK